MERSTIDLWVGLFMVAGVGALTILALSVSNMGSLGRNETYQLSAEFKNIGGLKPRAAVKSSGVVVGRVAAITFDNEKFVARVTMNIDSRYKFPQDTSASVLTAGLLGELSEQRRFLGAGHQAIATLQGFVESADFAPA